MISDKIKLLRTERKLTQSDIAKELGITRSSVNAWEMGISVPSTQYIVELALFFNVSSDYLLEIPGHSFVSTDGLSEKEVSIVVEIIRCLKEKTKKDADF